MTLRRKVQAVVMLLVICVVVRCLGSLRITITGVHTAASAGPLPPPACKQRPWGLQLLSSPSCSAGWRDGRPAWT